MGYDPIYGARPLRRIIQKEIENPLSLLMIQGTVKANLPLLVDLDQQNKFVFYDNSKAQPPQKSAVSEENKPADPKNDNTVTQNNTQQVNSDDQSIQTSASG